MTVFVVSSVAVAAIGVLGLLHRSRTLNRAPNMVVSSDGAAAASRTMIASCGLIDGLWVCSFPLGSLSARRGGVTLTWPQFSRLFASAGMPTQVTVMCPSGTTVLTRRTLLGLRQFRFVHAGGSALVVVTASTGRELIEVLNLRPLNS